MPRCNGGGGESFFPHTKNKLRYMGGEEGESGIVPRFKCIFLLKMPIKNKNEVRFSFRQCCSILIIIFSLYIFREYVSPCLALDLSTPQSPG